MSFEVPVEVHFHGSLKSLSDAPVNLSGHTMAEIISGLKRMFPELAKSFDRGGKLIKVVGFETKESFFAPLTGAVKRIDIVPAMFGGKNGGFLNIILGAVLVASMFLLPAVAAVSIAGVTTIGSLVTGLGVSLILGGLMSLLSPAPALGGSGGDQESSKYLSAGGANTTKIGTRIALLYGKHRVGGHYLSINVDAVDVAT